VQLRRRVARPGSAAEYPYPRFKGGNSVEKRVCFDFEIDFSNGGGIQGQGFRLDIAGHDITDDALADYIVRDMRLLMVGEVRILNKRIIEEAHKRRPGADPEAMN